MFTLKITHCFCIVLSGLAVILEEEEDEEDYEEEEDCVSTLSTASAGSVSRSSTPHGNWPLLLLFFVLQSRPAPRDIWAKPTARSWQGNHAKSLVYIATAKAARRRKSPAPIAEKVSPRSHTPQSIQNALVCLFLRWSRAIWFTVSNVCSGQLIHSALFCLFAEVTKTFLRKHLIWILWRSWRGWIPH